MNEPNSSQLQKPTGAALGWNLHASDQSVKSYLLRWRQDSLTVRGKGEFVYTYIEKAPAVMIVPVTRDGKIVLIRQYRYPVDDWCLEIPAGGTHDTGDASLEDVARQELEEETGATHADLEFVTAFYAEPSLTDEQCHVYLATNVEMGNELHIETTENIERQIVSVAEAFALARSGQMKSAPCTLALFLCQSALEKHGFSTTR